MRRQVLLALFLLAGVVIIECGDNDKSKTDTDTDTDSGTDLDADTDADTDTDTGIGTDTGTDTGKDTGVGVPEDWSCPAVFYNAEDGCDCGCTVEDPDCNGAGCTPPMCWEEACLYCFNESGEMVDCELLEPDLDAGADGGLDAGS